MRFHRNCMSEFMGLLTGRDLKWRCLEAMGCPRQGHGGIFRGGFGRSTGLLHICFCTFLHFYRGFGTSVLFCALPGLLQIFFVLHLLARETR